MEESMCATTAQLLQSEARDRPKGRWNAGQGAGAHEHVPAQRVRGKVARVRGCGAVRHLQRALPAAHPQPQARQALQRLLVLRHHLQHLQPQRMALPGKQPLPGALPPLSATALCTL